jgi:RNA polymerase sigma factor (TIGR02999 family)
MASTAVGCPAAVRGRHTGFTGHRSDRIAHRDRLLPRRTDATITRFHRRQNGTLDDTAANPAAQAPEIVDLFPLVYDELRRIARRQRRAAQDAPTLDTTALVHEAYLKLIRSPRIAGLERSHFLAVAARAMRQILVDQARRRNFRRKSGQITLTTGLGELIPSRDDLPIDMVALDRALARLAELDPRCGQAVELRAFAGLDVAEIAEVQGVTVRTVARDWRRACAFLIQELSLGRTSDDA